MSVTTKYQPETIRTLLSNYITQEIAYDQSNLVLTNDFNLIEQGVIDSMGILRLMAFIEEEFDLVLAPEDLMLENFVTLDAVTAFVGRKLATA